MNEEITPSKSKKAKTHAKKAAKSVSTFSKKPIAKKLLLVLVVIAAAYGIFYLGQQSGAKKQKELDAKKVSTALEQNKNRLPPMMNRKTFIGSISSIDKKTIEITPRTGDKVKVGINDETRITGSDAKKIDIAALKKDQKVIVSTTKDKNGSYTATRIRIQK